MTRSNHTNSHYLHIFNLSLFHKEEIKERNREWREKRREKNLKRGKRRGNLHYSSQFTILGGFWVKLCSPISIKWLCFKKLHSKNKWVMLHALKLFCSCVEIHECHVKFPNYILLGSKICHFELFYDVQCCATFSLVPSYFESIISS